MQVFNAAQGTQLRNLIRLLTLGITAFGLKLHADQIALVQGGLETLLAVFVASPIGGAPATGAVFAPGTSPPETTTGTPTGFGTPTLSTPLPPAQAPSTTSPDPDPIDRGEGYDAPIGGD